MVMSFYIKESRLDMCKAFIRTLHSARFVANPLKVGVQYRIEVDLSVEDGNKLSLQLDGWMIQDTPKKVPVKKNFWRVVFDFIFGDDDDEIRGNKNLYDLRKSRNKKVNYRINPYNPYDNIF